MDAQYIKTYYLDNEHFHLSNPNPEWKKKHGWKWDRGDCAIRALANATGIEWLTAFDYLAIKARRDYNVPNDMGGFRKWVIEDGAEWHACKAERGKKRITCQEFAESHPNGRYVIQVANHLTACVDGVLLDAWNPFNRSVVGYLDMTNFNI